MVSPPQSAPEVPPYRITFFYGPEPAEGQPARLCCTFNVKKRSWKGGVQIVVEVDERQIARAHAAAGFEAWLKRILSTLPDGERADYEGRARDLFVQYLCALKLDLAIEAGLRQENSRVAAGSFTQELDAAISKQTDRLLSNVLAELDLAGYGG